MRYISVISFLFVFAVFTFTSNSVEGKLRGRIIGGSVAPVGRFKYQVSIQINNKHFCGGGIINDRLILTAAHCVIDDNGHFKDFEYRVVAGVVDLNDAKAVVGKVDKIYVPREYSPVNPNSKYNPYYRNTADLAILKLKQPLNIESNPELSKLEFPETMRSNEPYPLFVEEKAVVAGFGYTSVVLKKDPETNNPKIVDGTPSKKLKYGKATVVPNDVCAKTYKQPIYRKHLCARIKQHIKDKPEGICSGDSGSPLVLNGKTVIGVVSSSAVECEEDFAPAVYTRITSFLPFIESVVNDQRSHDMRIATYENHKKYFNAFGKKMTLVEM